MSRAGNLPNLDKLFKEEDDQDFAPLGASNLAAIFSSSPKIGDTSSSVKQTPQKKINSGRSTPQTVQPTNKIEVIIAKAVHAYKLQNGQYSLIGKLGIALTGNVATRLYQIILYKSKQEHISVVTLTPKFLYMIREKNYATYYDGNNENWSILFENEETCIDFAREVGVSIFLSRTTKMDDSVFHQNLSADSDAEKAVEGDEISVKTVICTNFVQPLKMNDLPSQTMNVEISQYDNWEKSLLNASKGLKRLLILPPSKQMSLGPGFPREKEIIMEIEVLKVVKEKKIEEKSPTITESSVSVDKASVLSRMAKMGQSMLPKIPNSTTTDSDDTEEEVHIKSPRRFKTEMGTHNSSKHQSRTSQESMDEGISFSKDLVPRTVVPSNVPLVHRPIINSSAFPGPWSTTAPIQQQYVTMDGQYYPLHQPVAPPISAPIDPSINVFLSESRTQNSEIRMGMSKIADNVQKLLDKFHILEVQNASSPINERVMEHSLKTLMAMNATKFSDSKNSIITEKSGESYENSSAIDHRSKDIITELEKELKIARELMAGHANKIGELEADKREWNIERSNFRERIDQLEKSLSDAQLTLQKSLTDLKAANDLAFDYQKNNAILEANVLKLNAEKDILESVAANKQKSVTTVNDKTMEIKQIMNKTYQTLLAKFTDESYETEYIKETIANTIRNITLQVLKQGKDDEEPEVTAVNKKSNNSKNSVETYSKITSVASNSSTTKDINDKQEESMSSSEVNETSSAAELPCYSCCSRRTTANSTN